MSKTLPAGPPRRLGASLALAALALSGAAAGVSLSPSALPAVAATATYAPYAGASVNPSAPEYSGWVGSFIGTDGSVTYCIDGPRLYPWEYGGTAYGDPQRVDDFVTGSNSNPASTPIGKLSTDKLAWIMEHYGSSTDPAIAAAVQRIVWDMTGDVGLGSNIVAWNGVDRGLVDYAYSAINADAMTNGYTDGSLSTTIGPASDGSAGLDLSFAVSGTRFDGSPANPGANDIVASISGGAFDLNGNGVYDEGIDRFDRVGGLQTGRAYAIVPTSPTAGADDISVSATAASVVSDYWIQIRNPADGVYQRVIQAGSANAAAASDTKADVPTQNPARLQVATVNQSWYVSAEEIAANPDAGLIRDEITVGVVETPLNRNFAWPVGPDGAPVSATVTVTLYKDPGTGPIVQGEIPEGAVEVGSDSVVVTAPGKYTTPNGVRVTEPGRYVFVEEIKPVDVDWGAGNLIRKIEPFQGEYGIANESTYVPYAPEVSTDSLYDMPYAGTAVADTFQVSNFAEGADPVTVDVYAVGPFQPGEVRPEITDENDPDLAANLAGRTQLEITGDGEYTTPEIEGATAEEGTYYFMYDFNSTLPAKPNDKVFIPSFQDFAYHEEESYTVTTPRVETQTSDRTTHAGSMVGDNLMVTGLVEGDTMTVVSTLHGPLGADAPTGSVPEGAPVVGAVTTEVNGNGTFQTEKLQVPAPGHYVWTYEYATTGVDGKTKPAVPVADRTVYVEETTFVPENPDVRTTATDLEDGDHFIDDKPSTVVDAVSYTNLIPGREYTVNGELVDKKTGEPTGIVGTTTFIAETESGTVDITFEVPADAPKVMVAFEKIMFEGRELAVHADIEDIDQTIWNPELETDAADVADGDQYLWTGAPQQVVDTVSYSNLIPGKEYTVDGELVDRKTGEPTGITASTTFTPTEPNGTVSLTFDVPADAPTVMVAFETLTHEGKVLATHADISDQRQTVWTPRVGTSATDQSDGDRTLAHTGGTIVDVISYEGLKPGVTYTVDGELMDKATGQGTGIMGTAQFTPETSDGTVEVTFEVPASQAGRTLVAFETILDGDLKVAEHRDIGDQAQTVTVQPTPASGNGGAGLAGTGAESLLPITLLGLGLAGAAAVIRRKMIAE